MILLDRIEQDRMSGSVWCMLMNGKAGYNEYENLIS